jgi:hypothetical protein
MCSLIVPTSAHHEDTTPSTAANTSSSTQEIPRVLCNPEAHYRIHNSTPPVPILSQIDPVHASVRTSGRSILILSSHLRLGLPSGLLPSVFPTEILYAPVLVPYVLHALPISVFLIWSPGWYLVSSTKLVM